MATRSVRQALDVSTEDGRSQLEAYVLDHLRGRVREFQVEVHEHGLILKGWANTFHTKQLAQHLVMKVTRVPIAANELIVT